MTTTGKKYYARKNGYGVKCSSDSIGWHAYRFNTAEQRQAWINEQNTDGRYEDTAEKCTKAEAWKIAGIKRNEDEFIDYDGTIHAR